MGKLGLYTYAVSLRFVYVQLITLVCHLKTEDCVLDRLVTICICDAFSALYIWDILFASARETLVHTLISLCTGSDMEHEIC